MPSHRRSYLLAAAVAVLSLFVLVSGLLAGDEASHGEHTSSAALFSPEWYVDHIAYLASDELEGRGPGQEAIDVAADYIADTFHALGLEPAGDDGSYFQTFTLPLKNEIGQGTRLALRAAGRPTWRSLKLKEDHVPYPFSGSGRFKGEVVFVGYGISSDRESLDYDDYEDVDVEGKVVLVLDGTPEFTRFRWYEGAAEAKMWHAVENGAVAVLIANVEEDDSQLIDFDRRTVPVFRMASSPGPIPVFNIRREVAERMLAAADLPGVEAVIEKIEDTRKPVSAKLEGVKVKGRADVRVADMEVRNVVGVLPGSGPQADEYIVLGAHYDHHGIRNKGLEHFNPERDIYNGADDNASGVAMLMTLGRVFAQGPKPNRSLLFIAFTAEELGLHGSAHFTHYPTVDLDDCVAMLNFDMVGRLHKDRIQVMGMRTGEFEEMIERVADRYSLDVVDGGGARGGSDQSPFHDEGVPVLFFHTGLHKQYTKPGDDTERINGKGAMRIAKMAADCVDEIDAAAERPPFHSDGSHASMMRTDDADLQGQRIAAYLQKQQKRRALLGVKRSEDEDERGFLVSEVMPGMPAERAGVLAGDRIVRLGAVDVREPADLVRAVQQHKKGDETTVVVERDGEKRSLPVRFGEKEEAVSVTVSASVSTGAERGESKRSTKRVRMGVRVEEDAEQGLLITEVLRDTPARWAGLQKGDRLVKLGDATIATRDDLVTALAAFKPGDETRVWVIRRTMNRPFDLCFSITPPPRVDRELVESLVRSLDEFVVRADPGRPRYLNVEGRHLGHGGFMEDWEELVDTFFADVLDGDLAPGEEVRIRVHSSVDGRPNVKVVIKMYLTEEGALKMK